MTNSKAFEMALMVLAIRGHIEKDSESGVLRLTKSGRKLIRAKK